jgi:hypothetical protein
MSKKYKGTALDASEHPAEGRRTALGAEDANVATTGTAEATWRLWFAVRWGPWRTVKVDGGKTRARRLEMPPGPNGPRGNHFAHAQWVREWREAAWGMAEAAGYPPMERVRISAIFRRRALGTADEDNDRARLKPLVDGLRDAKIIPNDTRGHVVWGSVTEERADADGPGVLLIVEPLAPAAAEGEAPDERVFGKSDKDLPA